MRKDLKMLLIGDSFTWGEGLELYMNKEPFISMRNSRATDGELRSISDYKDSEVEKWRASKRFANYVDGFEKYVQKTNGGSFQSICRDSIQIIYDNGFEKGDAVIIQIPPADRSYFHSNVFFEEKRQVDKYENEVKRCQIYTDVLQMNPQTLLHWYMHIEHGHAIPPHIDHLQIVSKLKCLSNVLGYTDIQSYVEDFDNIMDKLAYRNTKLFYYSYVWDLMQKFDVYFIGPWGEANYKSFSKCDEFRDKLIPMIYNGKEYDSLQTLDKGMAKNNEKFEIAKEFSGTDNNHPTPTAHKIIGESINTHLINKKTTI